MSADLEPEMDAPTENGRFETDNSVTTRKQPRQQLSKAMEHMRFAVTVDPVPKASSPTPPLESSTPSSEPSESDAYGVPATFAPIRNPTTRSHDPSNNQKRTDPFAFGSRYLEEGDDIFEFNAWDHVQVDASYLSFSEEQYAKQRAEPVSDFDKSRFNNQPEKWWNKFYTNNKTNFFKNRKWLSQEFPVLEKITRPEAGEVRVLEVGAGAGNTAFPILERNANPRLRVHACDFSKKAVDLIRSHELYKSECIQADVWDVAASPESENGGLPPNVQPESVDVVVMIFIFSALNPRQWEQAVRNVWRVLKPGGQVLFRDYGRGDLAQVRFKKGRWMEENFYVRGDGTRVYFFEREELENIWGGRRTSRKEPANEQRENPSDETGEVAEKVEQLELSGTKEDDSASKENPPTTEEPPMPAFEIVHFGVDRRMLVNRQRRLKMYRCWMQAVFRKPGSESELATSTLRQDKATEEIVEETA